MKKKNNFVKPLLNTIIRDKSLSNNDNGTPRKN